MHQQLREKNKLIKVMKAQILQYNSTLPTIAKEQPDDDDWAW
jgi:hypothetical protein